MNKYDKQHNKNVEAVGRQIDRIYKEAVNEASLIGVSLDVDTDKPFTFDDYPQTKERINKMLRKLRDKTEVCIVNGINSEWTLANDKCDELANVVFGKNKGKLSQAEYRRYYSTNDDARKAFIVRKDYGLSLSDRVWRYSNEFKTEIEMGLDLGIRNGLSADEMSRELRQYLQHPNMLFRRVRDEHGILHLSQRAKQFHFGRGVYRSSYLNARRLAATETNIAYRTADHDRWKQMDFVVGIEVHLSGNHTCKGRDGKPHEFTDICDQLKGRYPKDFKFTGWHPHCRCYATTILKTPEEMRRDTKKILNGQPTDTESVNAVNDTPQGFKDWILANQERIERATSLPYFLRDNNKWAARALRLNITNKQADNHTEIVIKGIKKELTQPMKDLLETLNKESIAKVEVKMRDKIPSADDVVTDIAGGDMTSGSCSSVALAFAANMAGYDVKDFRGGRSQSLFAKWGYIKKIAESAGGKIVKHTSDFVKANELLKEVKGKKMYYFTCGSHAAIVRKNNDKYEYLELQSRSDNGWKTLDNDALKKRFCAKRSHSSYGIKRETSECIIDIDKLKVDAGFKEMLAFINTKSAVQKKGKTGTIK